MAEGRVTGVPAPLARRFASLLYETLLLAAVLFCIALPLAVIEAMLEVTHVRIVLQILLVLVAGAYFVWQWLRGGQTLAMKTWRLTLVSRDGATLNARQAWLRYIAALLTFPVNFLWAFFDRERLFLHDRIAKTTIIRSA